MIEIPINMLLRIDLAAVKLGASIKTFSFHLKISGKKTFRIKKGQKKLKRKKADRKQPVIEEYHRIDKTGMKPHRIATTIKENLEKWQRDVPSVDTIKRYLKEEKLIKP